MTSERYVTVELWRDGERKEYTTLPASEAAELIRKPMANHYRWQISPPDRTGELQDDEARFAADCEACGVTDPYANA